MKGKEYLISYIQDSNDECIIRVANALEICANEFFPKTHADSCTYSKTKDIEECKECWRYSLGENQ